MSWYRWKFWRIAYGPNQVDRERAHGYWWRRVIGCYYWREQP